MSVGTAAAIVYQLVRRTKNMNYDVPLAQKDLYGKTQACKAAKMSLPGPVLVCVPSNIAADEICERIHKTGVEVVRVMALTKQQNPSPVKELCAHVQALKMIQEKDPAMAEKIQKVLLHYVFVDLFYHA